MTGLVNTAGIFHIADLSVSGSFVLQHEAEREAVEHHAD